MIFHATPMRCQLHVQQVNRKRFDCSGKSEAVTGRVRRQQASNKTAAPCPTPTHIVARP